MKDLKGDLLVSILCVSLIIYGVAVGWGVYELIAFIIRY